MSTVLDQMSKLFLWHLENSTNPLALEIGPAFGNLASKAAQSAKTLYCIEPEKKHIDILLENNKSLNNIVCFCEQIQHFESRLLPKLDYALSCRVFHFLSGQELLKALYVVYSVLKPGGKLFIVVDTPFRGHWKEFLPEYQRRVESGTLWPGETLDMNHFEHPREKYLPRLLHWVDQPTLERAAKDSGFEIEVMYYSSRPELPSFALLDNRESLNAVLIKPLA